MLATGYLNELDIEGMPNAGLRADNSLSDVHDTGRSMLHGVDSNEIDNEKRAIEKFNNAVYGALGSTYRMPYQNIADSLSEEDGHLAFAFYDSFDAGALLVYSDTNQNGALVEDMVRMNSGLRELVRNYKPDTPDMEGISNANQANQDNRSNINLGHHVAQVYPDVHYAMVRALYEEGHFDGDPLQKDYAGRFIKSYERSVSPSMIDEGLVQQMKNGLNSVAAPQISNLNDTPKTAVLLPSPQ